MILQVQGSHCSKKMLSKFDKQVRSKTDMHVWWILDWFLIDFGAISESKMKQNGIPDSFKINFQVIKKHDGKTEKNMQKQEDEMSRSDPGPLGTSAQDPSPGPPPGLPTGTHWGRAGKGLPCGLRHYFLRTNFVNVNWQRFESKSKAKTLRPDIRNWKRIPCHTPTSRRI